MKEIVAVGKDIEQALAAGLKELDCKLDDVEVKILEHPGIFSKARVRLTIGDGGRQSVSDIMRDLEKRAKKDRRGDKQPADSRDRRDGRNERAGQPNADRRQGAEKQLQKGAQPQQQDRQLRRDEQRRQQNSQQPQKNAQPQQDKQLQKSSQPQQDKQPQKSARQQPDGQQSERGGFRNDFRAQLEAAKTDGQIRTDAAEKAVRSEKQEKPDRPRAQRDVPPEAVKAAEEYLTKVVSLMGITSETACTVENGEIHIELKCDDALVIGRKGETLDALEYLATLTACTVENGEIHIELKCDDALVIGRKGETLDALEYLATLAAADGDKYYHVDLDCGEYRVRRNEAIRAEAIAAADKAAATGRRVELEPMSSASRKEVHAALGGRDDVMTRSEGREPNRYVVIVPRTRGGKKGGRNGKHRRGKPSSGGADKQ